jgi:hypothetical protein
MASFALRLLASVAVLATGAGCGLLPEGTADDDTVTGETSEAEVRVADGVVVLDSNAVPLAEVSNDRVSIPAAAGERYRAMLPGTVFVGARGPASSKNPDGFLRRVTAVAIEGDRVVVTTTAAALNDAIVAGSVTTSSGGGKVDDHLTAGTFKGMEIDFSDETLFDNVDDITVGEKSASFHETITLERAVLTARPTVDVDIRIQENKVTRLTAKVEGNLDSSIRAVANVSSTGEVDEEILAALKAKKHEVTKQLHQSKRIALPTFSVGKIPVSPSVQFTVSLKCGFAFGGAVHANAGVVAKSYVRLGGMYDNGTWKPPIRSDFDIQPSFEVTRGAEIQARCAIVADAELFVYGTSGVTMSVAPYLDFDVATGAKSVKDLGPAPFVWKVQAGATGSMRGREGIFGLGAADLDRDLVDWKAATPLEGSTR